MKISAIFLALAAVSLAVPAPQLDIVTPPKHRRQIDIVTPPKHRRQLDIVTPPKHRRQLDIVTPPKHRRQLDIHRRQLDIVTPPKHRRQLDIVTPPKHLRQIDIVTPPKHRRQLDIVTPPKPRQLDIRIDHIDNKWTQSAQTPYYLPLTNDGHLQAQRTGVLIHTLEQDAASSTQRTEYLVLTSPFLRCKELVPVTIVGRPEVPFTKDLLQHKKNLELGTKQTVFSSLVFVDQADTALFAHNKEVTLMDWGNAIVQDIVCTGNVVTVQLHLEGDVKATKKKITWLGQDPNVHPVEALLVDYDYLITKKKIEENDSIEDFLTPVSEFADPAIIDANVGLLAKGAIIQLEHHGYYIVDKVAVQSKLGLVTLINVPDGKAVSTASKHKEDPSVKKVKSGKGNSWDKPKAKAVHPDAALSLPEPTDTCNMYESKHMYGDFAVSKPKDIMSMYKTHKYY
ncbi:glutamate--tRNA ligase [Coemansia sp. RSA 1972]|nr:glutamate--tRNA ligase [Coemansia sp. RSA 1972]